MGGAGTMTAPSPIVGYVLEAPPDLSEKNVRHRLSPDAIRAFTKLIAKWNVKEKEARLLLGGVSTGTFYELKAHPKNKLLDQDQLTRISLLLGIFKALRILYSDKLADAWVKLPNKNPMFGGADPVSHMIRFGVPGMERVRQLLDARRGG